MAKDQNILDAIHVVIEPGADVTKPGAGEWRIEGRAPFSGTYRTVDRTRRETARAMAKLIASLPWTAAHPDGYPLRYRALMAAYQSGRRVEMVVLAQNNERAATGSKKMASIPSGHRGKAVPSRGPR